MLYLDQTHQRDHVDAIWKITRGLLRGEWIVSQLGAGKFDPDRGLVYSLHQDHPDGPCRGDTDAPSVYEAAEQLWHMLANQSAEVDVRCRKCGFLDPVPARDSYQGDDDQEMACARCQTTDQLGHMRGVAPAAKPMIRARRKMMRAIEGE